jgi:phage tail-like protein
VAPSEKRNFLFLNRGGDWPNFASQGVNRAPDGSVRLSSLAHLVGDQPPALESMPAADGPAGVTADRDGNLYWSNPEHDQIYRRLGCDSSVGLVPCLGGSGDVPGRFHTPRGLLVPPNRPALFVVDSGNHCIQIFDLVSQQLVEIWGVGGPGAAPGQFNTPWTLVSDARGNVFVLDYGNQRVQKFSFTGDVIPSFWDTMSATGVLVKPSDLALVEQDGRLRLYVVDPGASRVFFFDADGNLETYANGNPLSIALDPGILPMGCTAACGILFLGDNSQRRILEYDTGGTPALVGEVRGYQGPVRALTFDSRGSLFVAPGGNSAPLQISIAGGFVPLGAIWSNCIDLGRNVIWHQILAEFAPLPSGAHLDVFAYASSDPGDRPAVTEDQNLRTYFSDPRWQRQLRGDSADVTGLYITIAKKRYLWVGAELHSDGTSSAELRNLRVEFDQEGYLPFLPAIYRNDAACEEFLPRLLALFQGFFEGVESEITDLRLLFDQRVAPKNFLCWLAGWLGLSLDDSWPEAKQRQTIAEAFAWFGRRGTRQGLEHSIRLRSGIDAVVEEPITQAALWCLPGAEDACCAACAAESAAGEPSASLSGDSVLGWTTVLAASQPDGAIVGSTAILDQSQLIDAEDFGVPLFNDVAWRFAVVVPRSALVCPDAEAHLRAVIADEMPAHTAYRLCVVDPRMRVGYQARVGIDTIIGGAEPPSRLGEGSALGGDPAGAIGISSRVGVTTRVG